MKTNIIKLLILFSVLILLYSCGINKNKIVIDDRTKHEVLIGKCDRNGFEKSFFNDWFKNEYTDYKPNKEVISKIDKNKRMNTVDILIIFGTWCGDSRRELPRFFKIEDQLNQTQLNYELIGVDTKKSSRDNSLHKIEFQRIPTFIFYENGKEIGRIVESTKISLEKDILDIITQ